MKTDKQSRPERIQLCQLIQHMSVTMLSTLDSNGAVISRPMLPLWLDSDFAVWFFTNLRSEKVKQRDAINLSFMDSTRANYVSLSGYGEIHTERAFINRLWTPFAKPWFPDGPESNHLALLKFVPEMADYWDSSQCKMLRINLMAAPVSIKNSTTASQRETLAAQLTPQQKQASR
jgi:general stress protein 26